MLGGGTIWERYVYFGNRVLEENSWPGTVLAFNTLESGSYYDPWLHMEHWDTGHSYPLYDGVGNVRGLADGSSVVTDSYRYDAFGAVMATSGSTKNFRRFGGTWGYMTDPSGLLQSLGPAGAGMAAQRA